MSKIVVTWGLISGGVLALITSVLLPLCVNGTLDFDDMEIIGYTSMVVSFLMVFFGIRTYRENVGRGAITFGRAFRVGLGITLISCAVYVVTWEIVYFGFIPNFDERYSQHVVQKLEATGASAAEVAKKRQEMADFQKMYKNPLINVGLTFLEAFPIGLIMTLISAAILRRKSGDSSPSAALA